MQAYQRKAKEYAKIPLLRRINTTKFKPSRKHSPMPKTFLSLGAINAFLCVALGAFGAHGLQNIMPADMLAVFHTGVQYHFYHALALMMIGLILIHFSKSRLIEASGWLMLIGIILFCGSLYVLSFTGIRSLGMLAPFGGLSLLSAWVLLATGIWKAK